MSEPTDSQSYALPALTKQRLEQAFQRVGWQMGENQELDMFLGDPNGWRTMVPLATLPMLTIGTMANALEIPAERYEEILAWTEDWNCNTLFGTAGVYRPEQGPLRVGLTVSFPCQAGLSDAQLDHLLNVALSCNLQGIQDLALSCGLGGP